MVKKPMYELNKWVIFIKTEFVILLALSFASPIGPQYVYADVLADSFSYQGRFLTADGSASLLDTVNITFGIYDPLATCLLYEESQSGINLGNTDGLFAVSVGSAVGDSKRTALDPGKPISTVFANAGTQIVPASATCTGGYTPASGDGRLFRVTVASLTTGVTTTLSPDLVISSVPMAKVAETLQGLTPSQLIQVQGSVSQASVAGLVGGADASTLHNHDSLYVKLGQSISVPAGGTIGLGSFDNSQQTSLTGALGLGDKGKVWINSDDNKLYYWNGGSAIALSQTASTVSGVSASAPLGSTGGTSPTLSISQAGFGSNGYLSSTDWNTFNNKLTSSLASGTIFVGNGPGVASAVSMSGDATLSSSGVLTLGNSGVTAGTYTKLTVDAKGRATVGANFSSADVTGALGFTPADSTNAVTSVGFTAPISSTGGTTPTISIATANTTTAGALTSTDWNTFNNKLTSSLASAKIFVGNGSGVATAVNLSSDATLSNTGALTLANSGVTAGTYTKLTVDAKGRATVGASLSSADVTGALGFTPANNSNAVTSVSGSAPISSTGGTTPTMSIATANTTTTGAISSTDWNTFNNKLTSSLASTKIFVGNGSGVATAVSMSNDATISNTGALTVASVGGVTAANVAAGANKANAATSSNSGNTIVYRDGSGNFNAGTVNLAGYLNVTGNTGAGDGGCYGIVSNYGGGLWSGCNVDLTGGASGVAGGRISIRATGLIIGSYVLGYSDERLKENIQDMTAERSLDFIRKVRPVTYSWKDQKGSKALGFIAQEVFKAGFKELVGTAPDPELAEKVDKDGFKSPKGIRFTLDYEHMVAILTRVSQHFYSKISGHDESIQALKKQNEELERRIKALEKKLNLSGQAND